MKTKEYSIIKAAVVRFMFDNKSFTSVDITNYIRKDGTFMRTTMVAQWLRESLIIVANQLGHVYNVSMITVDSPEFGDCLTRLYHHYLTPADNYLNRDQKVVDTIKKDAPDDGKLFMPALPSGVTKPIVKATTIKRPAPSAPVFVVSATKKMPQSFIDQLSVRCKTQNRDANGRFIKGYNS